MTKMKFMSNIELFRSYVDRTGSKTKAASRLRLSIAYVSELYNGRKPITPRVAHRVHQDTKGKIKRDKLIDWDQV